MEIQPRELFSQAPAPSRLTDVQRRVFVYPGRSCHRARWRGSPPPAHWEHHRGSLTFSNQIWSTGCKEKLSAVLVSLRVPSMGRIRKWLQKDGWVECFPNEHTQNYTTEPNGSSQHKLKWDTGRLQRQLHNLGGLQINVIHLPSSMFIILHSHFNPSRAHRRPLQEHVWFLSREPSPPVYAQTVITKYHLVSHLRDNDVVMWINPLYNHHQRLQDFRNREPLRVRKEEKCEVYRNIQPHLTALRNSHS